MKTLTVKIPEPLLAEIDAVARERRVSRSVIIRERLQAGTGCDGVPLWNRMEDLAIDDGSVPDDLSSNQEHLEGYGAGRAD